MSKFSEYFFNRFLQWEKEQTKKRVTYAAFADYLSKNSQNIEIKQQLVNAWIHDDYRPSEKYIPILAAKLGLEVYDALDRPRPDPILTEIQNQWEFLNDKEKERIWNIIKKAESSEDGTNASSAKPRTSNTTP